MTFSQNIPYDPEIQKKCSPRSRLTVKNDRGKKIMVTTVKTRMALLFDSAMMASSFCSIVRSWKSCEKRIRRQVVYLDLR